VKFRGVPLKPERQEEKASIYIKRRDLVWGSFFDPCGVVRDQMLSHVARLQLAGSGVAGAVGYIMPSALVYLPKMSPSPTLKP